MFPRIVGKIKRKENNFYKFLYELAWKVKRFNVPKIDFIYLPLYYIYISCLKVGRFFLQKFFYEPMFKAKCVRCGPGLRILHGMPLISNHLKMYIGRNVGINGINTFSSTSVYDDPVLEIGDNTIIAYECVITVGKRVTIGKNCLIGDRVFIGDNYGHPTDPTRRWEKVSPNEIEPVLIGNNVLIGVQAFIGKGVTIGDGAIIGVNSVVLNDVPANTVVLGNPAMVKRVLKPKGDER